MTVLGNTAARGTAITLAVQGLRFVVQTTSLVLLARLLTPEDFGLVAMVTAISGMAELVRDFGLSLAAVQAKDITAAERTNLFWANLGIGSLCAVAVAAATPLIVLLYAQPAIAPIVLAVAGVFVVSGASTQFRAELTRSLRFGALATADISAQILAVGLAIVLAVLGFGFWAIVAQLIAVAVLTLVFAVTACPWRPGLPRRGVSLRRFFRFGGGVLGTQLLAYGTKQIDNVAIGAVWGAAPLGLYSRAYQLLMTPLAQINAPMTGIALPVLSRVQHDDAMFHRYLAKAQLVGCYVTATALAVCAGLADPIVAVLFGPRWAGVAPLFGVLAAGGVFRAVSQICYWIYLARGRTGAQFRLYLVLRPIMIVIILAGLPWGPLGVAITVSVAFAIDWLATVWHVGRVTGVSRRMLLLNPLTAIFFFGAPCATAAYLTTWLVDPAPLQLALGLLAAAATAALSYLLVPPVRADLMTVFAVAARAVRRPARR
jgi:O-antigen/teichoic acid export membrane protein